MKVCLELSTAHLSSKDNCIKNNKDFQKEEAERVGKKSYTTQGNTWYKSMGIKKRDLSSSSSPNGHRSISAYLISIGSILQIMRGFGRATPAARCKI